MAESNEPNSAGREERIRQIGQIIDDLLRRRAAGEEVSDDSLIDAYPHLMPELGEELRKLRLIEAAREKAQEQQPVEAADQPMVAGTEDHAPPAARWLHVRCPHCHNPVEIVEDRPLTEIVCRVCGSSFSLVDTEPDTRQAAATKTLGHFDLIEPLGTGSFGTVWKARDIELDRTVAVKIPRKGQLDSAEQEQFLREARAAAQLNHPNIVGVHEVGREGDTIYIVSDILRGATLSEWLTQHRPTPREAAELCVKIAEALHHAHEAGVVHRDLKPSNIMLDAEGEPHIMDFGLAKREAGEITVTVEGRVLGTPAYMSPEQARGEAHLADRRSDVYSLGVVLFQLLTGELPFRGSERMLILQILGEEPPRPRKFDRRIPRDLETICLKCMEKDPDRRYPSCQHLAEDLDRFCSGEPIRARRLNPAVRLYRKVARRPALSVLIAAALSVIAVGGVLTVRGWHAQLDKVDAEHDRKVAEVLQRLRELFDGKDWSRRPLEEMHGHVVWLVDAAPSEGKVARQQLADSFSDYIESVPRIGANQPEIEEALDWLCSRDIALEGQLREVFNERLDSWEEVFDLAAPFPASKRESVFGANEVEADGDKLVMVRELAKSDVIYTQMKSAGPVSLEVVFDDSWEQAAQLAVLINAIPVNSNAVDKNATPVRNDEYRFVMRTQSDRRLRGEEDDKSQHLSFSAVRQVNGPILLEIFRGETCLQSKAVRAASLPTGSLGIKATKRGGQIEFEVGKPLKVQDSWRLELTDVKPVSFHDAFGFQSRKTGVFAIEWPPKVGILAIRGLHHAKPAQASPLQEGDYQFAEGSVATALVFYQEQAEKSAEIDTKQKALYKTAMCLLLLKRETEAYEILEWLAGRRGDRWPVLAEFRLLLRRVQQRQFDDAYVHFQSLSALRSREEVSQLIPSELRQEILDSYISESKSLNLYQPNANAVRDCEQAILIAQFFDDPLWTIRSGHLTRSLIRAHRAVGDEERALRVAKTALHNSQPGELEDIVAEYSWMLRVAGRSEEAFRELDHWLAQRPDGSSTPHVATLELVRVLAALDRWDEAETALGTVLEDISPEKPGWCYTSAWALLGFVRDHRGDVNGAQQAWKEGLRVEWQIPWYGFRFTEGLILASLTGELSESDAALLMKRVAPWLPGDLENSPLAQSLLELEFITSVLRNTFRTPEGREYARRIVFKELPFAECIRMPPILVGHEGIRQGAMAAQITDEQEAVIRNLVEDGYNAVCKTGTLGRFEAVQLAMTWKGTAGVLGWKGLAPRLNAELRGPLAYVMGHRYLHHLKRPEEAVMFFQTALKDAPPESSLKKLAQVELDQLAPETNKASSHKSVSP